jgi:DNA-binding Lrp family transcriptional regulator
MAGITDIKAYREVCSDKIDQIDLGIIRAVQNGIPLVSRPYQCVGEQLGIEEDDVIARLQQLIDSGIIKRYGVILRHHELGYQSNAMVVWNVPDDDVNKIANKMISFPFVTLCYRRPRRLPYWPYNLYSMIHGKDRTNVLKKVDEIQALMKLNNINYDVLFSKRRFKQRGAFYLSNNTYESIANSKAFIM